MPVRTAIFDFDGTIADTFETAVRVLNGLAGEYGYRAADAAEIQELRSMPPLAVAKRLGVSWPKVPLIVARARKEMQHSMSQVRPCAGVPEAIEALRAKGISLGLLTSNTRANVDLFLASNPIRFDFIDTGSGLWSKDRRLAAVLSHGELLAAETAYVGDEVRDIEAGRKLGLRVIAVAWGFTAPRSLAEHSPDHLVLKPEDLLRVLET
jgi:phosphoglycolate phosphatase